MYEKLQRQFKNRLEFETKSRDDIIKQQSQEIQKLNEIRDSQTMDDIPQLVDNKIGPVKVQNLSRISDFDRRGYQILASRFAELIRRRLTAEGKASIKFYVLSSDRTSNIEYLVPVSFIINMKDRTTDMILDESRL